MSPLKTIQGLSLLASTISLAVSAPAFAGADRDRRDPNGVVRAELPIPYKTGKVPVVFIHGMLGSPDNWSVMIEQLSADPTVSSHFQPLVFRYDSLRSIPDTVGPPRCAPRGAAAIRPRGRDAAFDRVILVGHSMGG